MPVKLIYYLMFPWLLQLIRIFYLRCSEERSAVRHAVGLQAHGWLELLELVHECVAALLDRVVRILQPEIRLFNQLVDVHLSTCLKLAGAYRIESFGAPEITIAAVVTFL